MAMRLLKDAPLEALGDDDGRRDAAVLLGEAIASVEAPACIAVYGSWGSGKTSLLRGVQSEWRRAQGAKSPDVWFEPWLYERRDDVLTALLARISGTLRKKGSERWGEARRLLVGALKTTLSLGARFGSAYLFGGAIPALKDLGALDSLKPEDYEGFFDAVESWFDEVAQVRESFHKLLASALEDGGRLVVFLDDLDRCQPEHALALIEGVKLLLCGAEGTPAVFVFALDRQVVGEAIRQRYPGSSLYTGESYLEKIFDLSVEVPGLRTYDRTPVISRWVTELGNREAIIRVFSNPDQERQRGRPQETEQIITSILTHEPFANPRVAKRALNRLSMLVHSREAVLARLGGPNPPGDADRSEHLARLVTWIAGAERFRTFRSYVRTVSDLELGLLLSTVRGERPPGVNTDTLSPASEALLATPGFSLFLEMLLKGHGTTSLRQTSSEGSTMKADSPRWLAPTVHDLDELLREVGL